MADSFIYRLNESTVIKTDDYTLFDIIDTNSGDYYTKKVSYGTLVKQLTSGIIDDIKSKLDTLQSTLNLANTEISRKLDKRGLTFSPSEIVTGILSVNARLSVFDIADFNKNIDLHRNQIKNLATPTENFDAVNKKYVDDRFNVLSIPNLGNYLLKTGDTMTGSLTLPSTTPTQNYHAATKKYVDDKFPYNVYLPLSGGVMTGNLVVLNPTLDNHPATKKYVDDRITTGAYLPLSGGTMTGNLSVLEPSLANHAATKKYVDDRIPNTSLYLPISGGTMTGDLFVAGNPINNSQVANKGYVDSLGGTFLPLSGGSMTGALSVLNPTLPLQAANKAYVDSKLSPTLFLPLSGGTMTGNLSVLEPSLANHAATKKYVDDKSPNTSVYLPLSGGTMTGDLFVANNPTNNSQVANKAYVDSKSVGNLYLPLSGGSMTGALSVLDPSFPLQAVNKKYADSFNPSGKYVLNSGGTMTGTLVLSGYTESLQSFDFSTAGALTINCATGNYNNSILLNLNANITHFNFTNIAPAATLKTYTFTFFIKQKGNIPTFYDITWQVLTAVGVYTNVKWASGAYTAGGPKITKLFDAIDIITLSRINGEWYGFSSGQNF